MDNVKVYQSFFNSQQYAILDKGFIPYVNLKNEQPLLREYPQLLDLYDHNKHYEGLWGLLSWQFYKKTNLTSQQVYLFIQENPGYDLYHFNPFKNIPDSYINPFVQGDEYHHPGMCDYINRLLFKLGYHIDIREERFKPAHFIYCSFYIGNNKFWESWITFLKTCIFITENDDRLKSYLYGYTSIHDGEPNFFNFPFVHERLVSLFVHLHFINVKEYVTHEHYVG